MYHSITFGEKNTWDDWRLVSPVLPSFAPPTQKTTYLDIPGASGVIDLSEMLTGYPIFNNRGILLRNERIALLADNVRVFYIDVNEAVCNDAGNLREDLTFDDLHLYGSKYGIWVDFLLSKGIGEISGSGQAE